MEEVSEEKKDKEFKIKLSGKKIAALALGIITLTSMLGYFAFNSSTTTKPTNTTIDVGQNPFKGGADAKVAIVLFSDFQCSYCQNFELNTLPQIESTYGNSIKIYFRNFPLTQLHPNAMSAAMAAECANEQGKFWEMHDYLFNDQNGWSVAGALKFQDYATAIGLNTTQFINCLSSNKYQSLITQDMADGISYGIQGTPTIFINGKMIQGNQPFSVFKTAIDSALNS
jgi:protein-disulfide isomerase